MIWWDPDAKGADEVGRDGTGLYRYADDGTRYLPGQWPKAKIALFDPKTSTTVLDTLPPEDAAAELPVAGRLIGRVRLVAGVVDAHPALALDVPADHPRRVADGDAEVGQRAGDHRARADHDVAADVGAGQHHGAVAEPRAAADAHRAGRRELLADRAA